MAKENGNGFKTDANLVRGLVGSTAVNVSERDIAEKTDDPEQNVTRKEVGYIFRPMSQSSKDEPPITAYQQMVRDVGNA